MKLAEVARDEPVLVTNVLRTFLLAGAGFGLNLSSEQLAALLIAVEAFLALYVRLSVTPVHTAELNEWAAATRARTSERAVLAADEALRSGARRRR